jgi:signal transduction histidine kinase
VRGRPFEREVRNVVVGGALFLLFLAGVSLVVLRDTVSWGERENLQHLSAGTRMVVERMAAVGDPPRALAGDPAVAQILRDTHARAAALYDAAGNRLAEASFLPDAALSPALLLPEERPHDAGTLAFRALPNEAPPAVAILLPFAGGRILRVVYDGAALVEARRNVRVLSIVVPAAAVVLALLVVPFLRRVMKPFDALTETARDAGVMVEAGPEPRGKDEAERAVATFARTIEELKKRTAELDELRRREKERADDLARTAETLVRSKTRLETELSSRRELAALGEMSAGIAHEFRNATATILGYARLASTTEDPAARSRHLAAIYAEAEHVARVTGDFLFFARPERLELSPLPLGELVEEITAEQKTITPSVHLATAGSFATASVDAALFRRALVNLLRNACEAASAEGREGRVVVRGEGVSEGAAVIAVEDDGSGVADEAVPNLFVPFFSTKESGTGLGLPLVAKIVALHGGGISVGRSAALGGARFVLSFPVSAPAWPSSASQRGS